MKQYHPNLPYPQFLVHSDLQAPLAPFYRLAPFSKSNRVSRTGAHLMSKMAKEKKINEIN